MAAATLLLLHCSSSNTSEHAAQPAKSEDMMEAAALPTSDGGVLQLPKEELTGRFVPASHPDFVRVGTPYTSKSGMMLRRDAYNAFKKMWEAAKKDGISLKIISSTRNFDQQKNIWEDKWRRYAKETPDPQQRALRILEYSSMPGTSRHHWGTDIDLNDLNNSAFEQGGAHKKVYDWLSKHASEYGFGQPYTPKGEARPHGYNEEKWHWSYLPLAQPYRIAYLATVNEKDINGFAGAETAVPLKVVERYVGGVGKACQ